jgi:hypothetical protein
MPVGVPVVLASLQTRALLYKLPWVLALSVHQEFLLWFLIVEEPGEEVM